MKISIFIILALLILNCTPDNKETKLKQETVIDKPIEIDIIKYIQKLQKAILNHNSKDLMSLINKSYKIEQHDNLLKGRTKQFIDELFGGKLIDEDIYVNLQFNYIRKVELKKLKTIDKDNFKVYFYITDPDNTIMIDWIITSEDNELGLIGAVG